MKEQILKQIEELKAKFEADKLKNDKRSVDNSTKEKKLDFLKQKFTSELKGLETKLEAITSEADETQSVVEAEKWQKEGRELTGIVRIDNLRKLYRFKKGK